MKQILLAFSLITGSVLSSGAMSIVDHGTSKVQLLRVKNMINGGDYVGASRILRDFEKTDSVTSELYYLSGLCNFHLGNWEDAAERLERSIALDGNEDPEKYFYLGRTFQTQGKLDAAVVQYQKFIEKHPKKNEDTEEAAILLDQSRRASEMMKNPVDVKIRNIGEAINSEFPEYNPSVSADGKTLIFTSRRPESTGKLQDPEDGKFYEDIYISKKDSITGRWKEAEAVPGQLNTETHDANMALSPDGKQIYVYRNLGARGSGAILISKQSRTGKWGEATQVDGDINTSYFESSACVSPDGKFLYFVSERPKGGFGMGDIYVAKREGKTSWGNVVNLGPVINDEYDQIGVFIHPDGKTLYYASNTPKSIGGYDIFKSTMDNKGNWTAPENLGYPINTLGDERFFVMNTDGKTAFFSSNRDSGAGDLDIWEIDFSAAKKAGPEAIAPQVPKGPVLSIFTGKVIDSNAGEIIEIELVVTEKNSGKTSSFSSDENGQYFITLEGDKDYTVTITDPLFKDYSFEFHLGAQETGTFTQEKLIVLDKVKK